MTDHPEPAGDLQPARHTRDGRLPAGGVAAMATWLLISAAAALPSRSEDGERARSQPANRCTAPSPQLPFC